MKIYIGDKEFELSVYTGASDTMPWGYAEFEDENDVTIGGECHPGEECLVFDPETGTWSMPEIIRPGQAWIDPEDATAMDMLLAMLQDHSWIVETEYNDFPEPGKVVSACKGMCRNCPREDEPTEE